MSAYIPNIKNVLVKRHTLKQRFLLFIRMPSSGTKIVVWTRHSVYLSEMSVQEALRPVSGNVPVRYSTANMNRHVHQGHYCKLGCKLPAKHVHDARLTVCRSLSYDSHSLRAYWFNQRTNQLSSQYSAHQCHFTFFFSLGIARITSWLHDDSFCLMLTSQAPHFEFILSRITRTHCTCSRYIFLRLSSLKSLNRSKRVTWQYIRNIHYTLDI